MLAGWIEDFLAGKNLIVHHEDITTEGKSDTSCPQGDLLSLLLWCLAVKYDLLDLKKIFMCMAMQMT